MSLNIYGGSVVRLPLNWPRESADVNVICFYEDAQIGRFTGQFAGCATNIKSNIRSNYLFDLNFTIENLLCPTRLQVQE